MRDVLIAHRRAARLTQEELAERSGVSVRTIRNLESGFIDNPRRSSVELLMKALVKDADLQRSQDDACAMECSPMLVMTANIARFSGPRDRLGADQPTSHVLIGRDAEFRDFVAMARECQVVVVTGLVGVGKTALAAAAVQQLRDYFHGRIAVVDTRRMPPEEGARESTLNSIKAELEAALGQPLSAEHQRSADPHARERKSLLVVDNAEHVVASVAELAALILKSDPALHLIVTSRRSLPAVPASVYELAPLDVSNTPAGCRQPPAVELFMRCAQAACSELEFNGRLSEVAELCRKLEGLPLAIEVAASLIRAVPLERLLRRELVFELIGMALIPGDPHRRTVADSVRTSYDLLDDLQREFLLRLAQTDSQLTIDQVEKCAGKTGASRAIGLLADLVDASLVQVHRTPTYRYRVPSIVRAQLGASAS